MQDDALSIIVCGSSAAVGLPGYLIWLKNETDLSLRVLLTHSAERFIQPQVVAWYADEVYVSSDAGLNPVEFAQRSLGIVVLPATANMLATAALGLAGTPAQTVLLASERPVLFFPSLNPAMLVKSSVKRHIAALRADGHAVVDPERREVFQLSHRKVAIGPSLPPADRTTELIIKWLENGYSLGESEPSRAA